jgi:hypothetical protein
MAYKMQLGSREDLEVPITTRMVQSGRNVIIYVDSAPILNLMPDEAGNVNVRYKTGGSWGQARRSGGNDLSLSFKRDRNYKHEIR